MRQALVEAVDAEDVAVEDLALMFRTPASRAALRDAAIHVPLDVVDFRRAQDLVDGVVDVIDDFRARKVEHILLAAMRSMAALRVQDPVGMSAVKLTVLVDHLELDPEAELHAERIDALRKARDAVRQAVGVRPPVAKATRLTAARGEPAIVEDEELDADIVRRLGDAHELLLIEIEVRGLPIVDEDGAHLVAPDTARQARAVDLVEVLAHAVEAVVRPDHDGLRRLERIRRRELPTELLRMDAHRHARDIEGVDLRLREEVAAVDEREADGLALLLVCLRALEDEERVVDMAGLAAQAADGLDTRAQVRDALLALAAPPARELHEVVVRIGKVNGEAHRARERHGLTALVDEIGIAGNRIEVAEDRVRKHELDTRLLIAQPHEERVRLIVRLHIRGRQPRQLRLARDDLVRNVAEVRNVAAVRLRELHCALTEVRSAVRWVLLTQMLAREAVLIVKNVGRRRAVVIRVDKMPVIAVFRQACAEVELAEMAVAQDLHDVTDPIVVEMELLSRRRKRDAHRKNLLKSDYRVHIRLVLL